VEETEVIIGLGHQNVQATHPSTIEFTKDPGLSNQGDCVLVVSTNKGLTDLNPKFREALREPHARLTVRIEVDDIFEEIVAFGSPRLPLSNRREMVLRKSDYLSNRTLGIHADKAANDLSRKLVEKLKNPAQKAKITLTVQS